MEYLYLAAAALGSFALGWQAARLTFGRPMRPPVVQKEAAEPIEDAADDIDPIVEDDFTRSVNEWGMRLVR
jgi:hypothetical protein